MYVSRLEITNFRNFGDPPFVIALKPFTLLLGENNIGKSNLLCALSLLFSQELSVVQRRMLEIDDFNYHAIAAFKRQVLDETIPEDAVSPPEIIIDATLANITDDQHPVVGDWYSNADLTEARVTYRFALRSNFNLPKWIAEQRAAMAPQKEQLAAQEVEGDAADGQSPEPDYSPFIDFPISEYRYSIYGGGRPSNECEAYLLRMMRAEILDALRDAEHELIAGGEQRLLYRVLRQSGSSRYSDIKRLLADLKSAIDLDSSLTSIKVDVERLLKTVSLATDDEDHSIGLQFAALEASEILKKIGMTYGANPMTVARNGLGRNNLLYVALVLSQLAKTPDLSLGEDDFVCFRIVGIEEPEAHLHPHLQDHLASNVEEVRSEHSDTLQLILTSHSTHIAAKLQLQNTAVLFRSGADGQVGVHYVLSGIDPVADKDAIRFLSLYLDATKARMFFARRLILVEGIAEQTLLPILFHQSQKRTLESIGCTVINVNGVAFRHFLTIIKNGYFKNCAVLTDSDAGTKAENRADGLRADFATCPLISIFVTSRSTFEKDLIAANASGPGKAILFAALNTTKPRSGPLFQSKTGDADIDVDAFFSEIAEYKAEFAFSLVSALRDEHEKAEQEKRSPSDLSIPQYIHDAFQFILESR